MHENWLLVGWSWAKIVYSLGPPSPVSWLCSLSPVLSPALTSRLSSLSFVLCTLSIVLSVALFHYSCPLLLCFPSSVPPSLVLCPLSFILARMRDFLKNIPFSAELFVEFARALQRKHKRIPGSGLLYKKHQQTLKTLWQIPSKLNICQKSVGNFLEFSMWVQLF